MAAITPKTLADGQLTGSKATLYTCPASTVANVKVWLANTSTTTAYTINLYVKRSGGTSRRVIGASTPIAASAHMVWPDDSSSFWLSAGDVVEGDASTTTVIDYTITGGTAAV